MKNLETQIDINAKPETVWRILTNLEQYSSWNPFIIKAGGKANEGEQLQLKMLNGKREMEFTPTVQVAKESEHFQWLGKGMGGMFIGQHYFLLSEANGQTKLIQGENFTGLLGNLLFGMIKKDTMASFEAMNLALKKQAESSGN